MTIFGNNDDTQGFRTKHPEGQDTQLAFTRLVSIYCSPWFKMGQVRLMIVCKVSVTTNLCFFLLLFFNRYYLYGRCPLDLRDFEIWQRISVNHFVWQGSIQVAFATCIPVIGVELPGLLFGLIAIGLAYLSPLFEGVLVQLTFSTVGSLGGPLLGMFVLGIFFPFTNSIVSIYIYIYIFIYS